MVGVWIPPRCREVPKVLVIPSIITAAALDYLVIAYGLMLLPPLGFFLHPGLGPWAVLEVYAIDALVLAVVLWLADCFSGRRASAIIASALGAIVVVSIGSLFMIHTYTQSLIVWHVIAYGFFGMWGFMDIAMHGSDP